VSFFDYSYRFPINFELFCSDLSVFYIPEFTDHYPFPTFPFTDSDRTKIYAGENGERFFLAVFTLTLNHRRIPSWMQLTKQMLPAAEQLRSCTEHKWWPAL
jgi:hypothetical protein